MKYTVSTLVKYLKIYLEDNAALNDIEITGELSNVKLYDRYMFFTLKDDSSAIPCAMFYPYYQRLGFKPKVGDKVEIIADISVYEKSGSVQLNCKSIKMQGIGDLHQQFEMLKEKLSKLGYFDEDHKKELLVKYPENVCVLVGNDSAAMSDIKTCFDRRWPLANVEYYPVLVQGENAAKDIIEKLNLVDLFGYDYIILARGGGSFEDLFCFNDEELVKTIYNLNTFIVTGVGHEQDFTLVDFVSDLRAPTPTAAVELTTPNISDVLSDIDAYRNSLDVNINTLLGNTRNLLDKYLANIDVFSSKVNVLVNRIDNYVSGMFGSLIHKFVLIDTKLNSLKELLNAYSINHTLERGFSIVYKNDSIINDVKSLKKDDEVKVVMYKGSFISNVKEKING